ncbi:MAG: hypothetical protein LW772_05210 [Bacteroidetes bacterium]|nr:hypothetical protein [Bacteroidota bacterium]
MNRTALTVVLVILLLASLGSNTFLYINKMKSDKELQNKMAVMKAKDSLQAELIRMEDSLNLVIQTFQNENQMKSPMVFLVMAAVQLQELTVQLQKNRPKSHVKQPNQARVEMVMWKICASNWKKPVQKWRS